jgi:hypothetical protein
MKKDVLSQLIQEAQSYRRFEDIEKLVEHSGDLSAVPLQPLFLALRATTKDYAAMVLPKLSQDQRQAMLDIDIWKKDEIDPQAVNWWLDVYGHCPSQEIRSEFAQSEDFLLALKCQCTILTFDAEEPEYPESDNYFITEDNLLLIEYPDDFPYVSELRQLVKDLYTEMGVEGAYSHLFKMVADSYMVMEEDNYQRKKERLRDYGFVDYYEALELDIILASADAAKAFIREKKGSTGDIDDDMKNQTLHASTLVAYQEGLDDLKSALESLSDRQRRDYLQFNFVRLVNARIMAEDALKGGAVAMTRAGSRTRQRLELGFSLAIQELGRVEDVFTKLDFTDLYRLGNTLLETQKRKLKRSLSGTPFDQEDQEYFLGMWWTNFLDQSLDEPVKLKIDGSTPALEVRDMRIWNAWVESSDTFMAALPFVKKFHTTIKKLSTSGDLLDAFYHNYELATLDFEAIMLSSFVNFTNGHFERSEVSKMGVSLNELKAFYQRFFQKRGNEWLLKGEEDAQLAPVIDDFTKRFGLSDIPRFSSWLKQVIVEQMNGYEIDTMSDEDFRHVGGPLLFSPNVN